MFENNKKTGCKMFNDKVENKETNNAADIDYYSENIY